MNIDDKIIKYIDNEKDISRCRISILERLDSPKPSKKRILELEKSFVNFPFDKIEFSSLEEAKDAVELYKSYRTMFFQKYNEKIMIDSVRISKEDVIDVISKKFSFLLSCYKDLMSIRVQEVNLAQDPDIIQDFIEVDQKKNYINLNNKKNLASMELSELLKAEPSVISKRRARKQSALFSLGVYIKNSLRDLCDKPTFNSILYDRRYALQQDLENLLNEERSLDDLFASIGLNIFKNYNYASDYLSDKLYGTMGENRYIGKTHRLINLLDDKGCDKSFYIKKLFLNRNVINTSIKRDKKDSYNSKAHGILFPIKRVGNEKMSIFDFSIFYSGINISPIFSNSFSHILAQDSAGENSYFKCLLINPIYDNIEYIMNDKIVLSLYEYMIGINKLSGEFLDEYSTREYINDYACESIFMDVDLSSVMVAKTRTENDLLLDTKKSILKYIKNLNKDYNNINELSY